MADERINIHVDSKNTINIISDLDGLSKTAKVLVRDAVFDIVDIIAEEAKVTAPVDKDPDAYTWRDRPGRGKTLKEHPVDVFKSRAAGRVEDIASFGGGFAVRGPGGRFVAGGAPQSLVGQESPDGAGIISIPEDPYYAIFVHEGTSAHTPVNAPFMRYKSFGKWHKRLIVSGQEPQPYITEAYDAAQGQIEARLERLRAELDAAT